MNRFIMAFLMGSNGLLFLAATATPFPGYQPLVTCMLGIIMLATAGYIFAQPDRHCLWALAVSIVAQLLTIFIIVNLLGELQLAWIALAMMQFVSLLVVDILLGFRRLAEAISGAFSFS